MPLLLAEVPTVRLIVIKTKIEQEKEAQNKSTEKKFK